MSETAVQQELFCAPAPQPRLLARSPDTVSDPTLALLPPNLPSRILEKLRARTLQTGENAITCAVASGLIHENEAYQNLCQACGFLPPPRSLSDLKPSLKPGQWAHAVKSGVMRVTRKDGSIAILFAPSLGMMQRLLGAETSLRASAAHVIVTSPRDYEAFIRHHFAHEWVNDRVHHLREVEPDASSHDPKLMVRTAFSIICSMGLLAFLLIHSITSLFTKAFFAVAFTVWSLFRIWLCGMSPRHSPQITIHEADLPRYSILVPLYDEASMLPQLTEALNSIAYPVEKLDIILILEADDARTIRAVQSLNLPSHYSIITVPPYGPRTKPKALAAALPFAKGELIVVYDAEDRPHPLQLQEAAARFRRGGIRLACLQAPLVITHYSQNLIAKMFALEYAGLFRTFLPALAHYGLPLPLGGTSNHFRRVALDNVGGWDSFNVTEDADLGIRLARMGWQVDVLQYPTGEHAVSTPSSWLKQRRRWFKGWMQTLAVCARTPATTFCQLGLRGSLGLMASVLASTLVALVHPLFLGMMMVETSRIDDPHQVIALFTLASIGYGTSAAMALIGLSPRERTSLAPYILLIPLYWLALSLAAWLAVFELMRRPFHWDKTAHQPLKRRIEPILRPARRLEPAPPAPRNI